MDLPSTIAQLSDSLEGLGFLKIKDSEDEPMLDRVIVYEFGAIKIRFWDEFGKWFVDFSEAHKPTEWYHTGIMKCAIGEPGDANEIDISEEAGFWATHLEGVLAFFRETAEQAHERLAAIALEKSKRDHPEWYGL